MQAPRDLPFNPLHALEARPIFDEPPLRLRRFADAGAAVAIGRRIITRLTSVVISALVAAARRGTALGRENPTRAAKS